MTSLGENPPSPEQSAPRLYLITGISASGKSTVCGALSEILQIPYISKDEIKEALYDELGTKRSIEAAHRMDNAAYELVFLVLGKLMISNSSVIVESNFRDDHVSRLNELISKSGFDVIQMLCRIDRALMLPRFRQRWESGARHPGHFDNQWYGAIESDIASSRVMGGEAFLALPGQKIELDTSGREEATLKNLEAQLQDTK